MTTLPASPVSPDRKKITIRDVQRKKQRAEQITMLTAYDYATALVVDRAGLDIILVGDSLGMVVLGYENTLPVTMEEMLHHCKAVKRGAKAALLVGDMPFMSYQISEEEALRNAGRFLQEASMDAVKLEGGRERAGAVKKITGAGIPVMGHLGLTPQSVHQFGGFRSQATTAAAASRLVEDALILQEAGCFSLVLEAIPEQVARWVTAQVEIPTLGIGAGPACDGQVLVTHDLLGLFDRFTPSFAKRYTSLYEIMSGAVQQFKTDVETKAFPAPEHTKTMKPDEWARFQEWVGPTGEDGVPQRGDA